MTELFWGSIFELVDNLENKLVIFLAGNWADFEMVETASEQFSNFRRNRRLGDIKSLVDVKC